MATNQKEAAFTEKVLSHNVKTLNEQIDTFTTSIKEYDELAQNLVTLSEKSSKRVMIPICDVAFMPGKLKHTNEVHVHLGDNWFVQRTAVECGEIIERRKEKIQSKLDGLKSSLQQQVGIKDLFTEESNKKVPNTKPKVDAPKPND